MSLQRKKISNLQRLLRTAELRKPLLVLDHPHLHATISINGLGIEAFDREGNPKPNTLMSTAGLSRIYSLNIPYDEFGNTFLDWATLTEQDMMFASASKLKMCRRMYDAGVSKSVFDCKTSLGFVGNSSVALVTDLYIPDQPEPIFQQMNQLVCIDITTRRPKPLPDWFKENFKGKGVLDKGVIVKPMKKPSGTFVYDVKVAWSDTDFYNHTNYASYVRFSVDAVHAALLDLEKKNDVDAAALGDGVDGEEKNSTSPLKGLTNEIVRNGLKSVEVCYLKESLEGQRMDLNVWQDEGQPCVVKCVIESDGFDICDLTLEYYDNLEG